MPSETLIAMVRDWLDGHPEFVFTDEDGTIVVDKPRAEGFSVWARADGTDLEVGFDGWHEHFDCVLSAGVHDVG